ncbi:hypothetical protein FRC00_008351, partial [Tulasnella sp. 408]
MQILWAFSKDLTETIGTYGPDHERTTAARNRLLHIYDYLLATEDYDLRVEAKRMTAKDRDGRHSPEQSLTDIDGDPLS